MQLALQHEPSHFGLPPLYPITSGIGIAAVGPDRVITAIVYDYLVWRPIFYPSLDLLPWQMALDGSLVRGILHEDEKIGGVTSFAVLGAGRMVTATRDPSGNLLLIVWDV
jgi:hypothetical protein